jgi:photosystem II stability/assembly factor-like uncharacterized protein
MKRSLAAFLTCVILAALSAAAVEARPGQVSPAPPASTPAAKTGARADSLMKPETFTGLALRGIGPAVNSGRIIDLAVHPTDRATWYVAVACGNVWKTVNAGITWTPIFDNQVSYSIGCVAVDPKNPLVVWVGTGENNSQRSVGFGDGVYRSDDGGKTWENVGLKASEHIGKIVLDPRDPSTVYVAAQGPLWTDGGDRGLYKSTDGGKSWKKVLDISPRTGVSDLWYDPRNPDVLYATAYQRRRHVWALIDGGPESAIYKSTDAGATWKKLKNGLPKEDLGRIGLAVSPADPDVVYAVIEAASKKAAGTYRSTDAGGNWEKMGDYSSPSAQYYQELIPDPKVVGRVYSMDTWMMVTEDGGKTWKRVGEKYKHVDNHALWIDPADTEHLIAGCDGGLYDSYDRGATWRFFANLPVTQFYKVCVDNASPIYNVYGGTQDNNTLGGPVRTRTNHGIMNQDWFVTTGGDGFQSQVDPAEPNIVYSESQHGVLIRYDRLTGEEMDIQPQPGPDGTPLRWNWDSPLLISPHAHTRLYFAAQQVFRSDDRGDSWRAVSPDLTRQIDRNQLKMMGRVWGVDAVAKNASTSFYGNIVALAESPLAEGLLFVGTDDGLVQVSEDGGTTWRRIEKFPGVPELSYVSRLTPSQHERNTVYATFDNHKLADFKPYVLKSTDLGRTWTSIAGNLPERGPVWVLVEDHVKRDLLFVGTEFGVFFTNDGGKKWVQLKGGIPVNCMKDLAIQKRENDLVVATFGRGFYVLDDYSPLRAADGALLGQEAALTPIRPAWAYVESSPLGGPGKSQQGDGFYTAPNPPFGAVFTYYLRDEIKTRKEARHEKEAAIAKKGGDVFYPPWDELRAEAREEDPAILLTVTDADGNVVRRLTGPVSAGFHRVAWDLRFPPANPTSLAKPAELAPWDRAPVGPLAAPGEYQVSLAKRQEGKVTPLAGPVKFSVVTIGTSALPAADRAANLAFQRKVARLQRAVLGAIASAREAQGRLDHLKKALEDAPAADPQLADQARAIESRLKDLQVALTGDQVKAEKNEPVPPSIQDRVQQVTGGTWFSTSAPTETHRRAYDLAAAQFGPVLEKLRGLVADLKDLEDRAESAGAPWTPGRVPTWTPE